MDTFLISFSLICSEDLESRYQGVVKVIKLLGTNYLELSKTCWIVRTRIGRCKVCEMIQNEITKTGSDGRIFIVDIGLCGWSFHGIDRIDVEMGNWIKKHVSGE